MRISRLIYYLALGWLLIPVAMIGGAIDGVFALFKLAHKDIIGG